MQLGWGNRGSQVECVHMCVQACAQQGSRGWGPGVTVIHYVLEHSLSTYCMPGLAQLGSERNGEGRWTEKALLQVQGR